MDTAILRYTQSGSMTPIQFASGLYDKSCKVADVYYESILNDIFIKGVNSSNCHSLWEYWGAPNPQADLTDIAFKAQLQLAIQKGSTKPSHTGNHNATAKQFGKRSRHNKTANVVSAESTPTPSPLSRHLS